MKTSDYKELVVWQKSIDLAMAVYKILPGFPNEEKFGLCDQIRRATVSIPSNIAEGQSRNSEKDFMRFLSFARGSVAELETQLLLSVRFGYINDEIYCNLTEQLSQIGKMLASLMRAIENAARF